MDRHRVERIMIRDTTWDWNGIGKGVSILVHACFCVKEMDLCVRLVCILGSRNERRENLGDRDKFR
jgi:hypothetical protein